MWFALFYIIIVVFGTYLTMNLVLGVLSSQYELSIRLLKEEDAEAERLALEAEEQQKRAESGDAKYLEDKEAVRAALPPNPANSPARPSPPVRPPCTSSAA